MSLTTTPSVGVNFASQIHAGAQGVFVDGNLAVDGTTELDGAVTMRSTLAVTGAVTQTAAAQAPTVQAIPLNAFRAPAAWKDALGDTATAAILGLADTRGSVLLSTAANGAAVNQSAVASFTLPPSYKDGAAITIRVRAKMDTTLVTVTNTIDVVVKAIGDTLGSDICTTAAQTITTSFAAYDFTVTPTGLVAGDILAVEVFAIIDDTGGTINKACQISRVEVRTAVA